MTDKGGEMDNLFPDIDVVGWLWANPWVPALIVLVIIGAIWFGIKQAWNKLTFMYNAKGDPLPPLGFTLKRAFKVMYKEDIYPVFTKSKLASKFTNFTWRHYWTAATVFTVLSPGLFFLPIPTSLSITLLSLIAFAVLAGIAHLRKIFAYRHYILMQMFEVANDVMRYQRGAELNPWGYVQIQEWKQLYLPGNTYVMYPAKFRSEDERTRATFEKNFSGTVSDQTAWAFSWESSQNRVLCEPVPFIVDRADYVFPDTAPWNIFPLGIGSGGKEVAWNVSDSPHCLVAGTTGSGKSVTQATILLHALQSPEWRVLLVDPKRVELSVYRSHPHVLKVATELEDSLALIEQLEAEMHSRYEKMTKEGVNNFRNLKEIPPAILLMVDETFQLLSPTGIKSEQGKEQDEMKARIGILLSSIARLGRASGVHMVLATQRPDAKVLPGELKANLDARIAQGRMDTIPSMMTLDSDAATHIPAIKGRAVYRDGQSLHEFQAYFMPPQQLPLVVQMASALARGNNSFIEQAKEFKQQNTPKAKQKSGLAGKFTSWMNKKEEKNKQQAIEQEKKKAQKRADREALRAKKSEERLSNLPVLPGEKRQVTRPVPADSTPAATAKDTTVSERVVSSRGHYPEVHDAAPTSEINLRLPEPELLGMEAPEHTEDINDWDDVDDFDSVEYWNPDGSDSSITAAEAQASVFNLTVEQVRARSRELGRDITISELVETKLAQDRAKRPIQSQRQTKPEPPATPETPANSGIEIESSDFEAHLGAPWMPTSIIPIDTTNSPFARD